MSERPERPEITDADEWMDWASDYMAWADAEIARLESDLRHYKSQFEDGVSIICRLNERRAELEAGREAFAREVCLMFSEHWNSGYDELPMIDRAIAAVKAREGK